MVLLSLLLMLQSPVKWNSGDWVTGASTLAAIVADGTSTIAAVRRGAVERNPFLGPRPNVTNVIFGCALAAGVTFAIVDVLPHRWRRRTLVAIALIGVVNAVHNSRQQR